METIVASIQCPFFINVRQNKDGDFVYKCESSFKKPNVRLFESRAKMRHFAVENCCSRYRDCPNYQYLMMNKYSEKLKELSKK